MSDRLKPVEYEINRLIDKLDQKAVEIETKWGVYFLESRCSPEIGEKWDRQVQKLNEAISNSDLSSVSELVGGCIRGYDAMEKDVLSKGIEPLEPDVWKVQSGSRIFNVVKTIQEARKLEQRGVENVVTAQDAARLLGESQDRVLEDKKINKTEREEFDFEKGDEIPI